MISRSRIIPGNVPPPQTAEFDGLTDDTQAPVYYMGWSEDATIYTITRMTVAMNGTSVTGTAIGAWADRYTLPYA